MGQRQQDGRAGAMMKSTFYSVPCVSTERVGVGVGHQHPPPTSQGSR